MVFETEFGEIDIDRELVVLQDDSEENLLLLHYGRIRSTCLLYPSHPAHELTFPTL